MFNENNQENANISVINDSYGVIDIENNVEYKNKKITLDPNQLIVLRKYLRKDTIEKAQFDKVDIKYEIVFDGNKIEINLQEEHDNLFL